MQEEPGITDRLIYEENKNEQNERMEKFNRGQIALN